MRTAPFRVSRLALAYLGVAQYLRTYWWFAAIIPGFGLALVLFGPTIMKAMGFMALLWPLGLPARAIFATSKAGKLLQEGAWASLEDGTLYLHGEAGDGLRLNLAAARRVERRRGFLVVVLARGDFVAVPLAGIPLEFAAAVEREVSPPTPRNLA